MRQAVTTLFGLLSTAFFVLAQASAEGTDGAATTAQARRLIDAKDYSAAMVLLEDALTEADAKDRPAILELLRQSYRVMAEAAEKAGRDREAAHFRDNLAIIERRRLPAAPPKSTEAKPSKPDATKPLDSGNETAPSKGAAQQKTPSPTNPLPGSAQDTPGASPPAAAPVPENPKLAAPDPLPPLPRELSTPAAPESLTPGPISAPPASPRNESDTTIAATDRPAGKRRADEAAGPAGADATKPDAKRVEPGANKPAPAMLSLEEGDQMYRARRYDEAGKCYASLARQNRLPARRLENWAYCRMVEVARRVNARPKSSREWDEIEAEIVSIQRLTPNIWYGEYLRNKVAEVRRSAPGNLGRGENLIVRASAPDETNTTQEAPARRFPRLFGKSRAATQSQAQTPAAPPASDTELPLNLPSTAKSGSAVSSGSNRDSSDVDSIAQPAKESLPPLDVAVTRAEGQTPASTDGGWQVLDTPNFRVFHQDARLARDAGEAAESVRAAQAKRWGTSAVQRPWTPRCDLYLYPSGKLLAKETSQPESSPGFSTMACNGDRITARRTNLRADHPQMLAAILPHEITHVVLADLFTLQQIPRWADEGIAVLAEPTAEQGFRASELQEPLESGRVFDLSKLMTMDYPEAKHWSLYYAQSVSLTRFLVELGQPEQLIQFVRDSQRDGIESALRSNYQIAGFAELQTRWTDYAKRQFAPPKVARRDPEPQSAAPAEK
jgi:hypothetical protein